MGETAILKTAKGDEIIIDAEDYPLLSCFTWVSSNYGCPYTFSFVEKCLPISRLILDPPKGFVVDHINGNILDNRKENLRVCTHTQNMWNRKTHKNNKLGVKGVYYCPHRCKYVAQIKVNKKKINLGRFNLLEDAAQAYRDAALLYHGEFARIN